MTSINFNVAATSALRTLQSTNSQLDATQNRISTGLKIGEAKDNAAYWSISTTLKSDNKALSTVKDALSLGAATVDTAYQGLNATLDVLNEITSKLTAASGPNVDRAAVQREITELQNQLSAIAAAATFSGENWLKTTGAGAVEKVTSGFTRDSSGSVTLATISVDTSKVVLTNGTDGILDGAAGAATTSAAEFAALFVNDATTVTHAEKKIGNNDVVTIGIDPTGAGTTKKIVIDQNLVNKTLNVTDGTIRTTADLKKVVDAALIVAGLDSAVSTTADATTLTFVGGDIDQVGTAAKRDGVLNVKIDANTNEAGFKSALDAVGAAIAKVTAAATTLGAVAKRIDLQQTFVSNLMDTIDKGVSGLVDADMNEESTKLQALQVKQQLGVQALSIANQSAQNVLSLFRS